MLEEIRFVTADDGVRIACASSGSGEQALVKAPNWLSHVGADHGSPVWRHWWKEFARQHFFIRFDQRGSGLSDWAVKDLSFDRWVQDLECVIDAYGLGRFVLVGMSQGGPVAVAYAARHPDRVSRLVLIGAYARGWARRGHPDDEHRALLTLIQNGWGSDNPAYRQIFTSQFMPGATPEQMNWFNDLERVSSSPENAVRFQMEVGQIDVSAIASTVRVPTIVFHSRGDARVPFDEGRRLAAMIPDARFIPLDGKNHILLESEPAWTVFAEGLAAFLRKPDIPDRNARQQALRMATLTKRELEVLQLVATGKTDREVASDLSLSLRTVQNHMRNILDKTGCSNRTAAATLAAQAGIFRSPATE